MSDGVKIKVKHLIIVVLLGLAVTGVLLGTAIAGVETIEEDEVIVEAHSVNDETLVTLESMFFEEIHHTREQIMDYATDDSQEVECLITAIFFEAGGEPELGKRWVFDVIDNRRKLGYRGKASFCEVIYDRWQFSFANMNPDRVPNYSRDLIDTKELVLEMYYDWEREDQTGCSTHYLAYNIVDPMDVTWARQALEGNSPEDLVWKATIGEHMFFGPSGGC